MTAPRVAPDSSVAEPGRPARGNATVTLTVSGGFNAGHRVCAMLCSRMYDVCRMSIDVAADGGRARVTAHVTLPSGEVALLRARLERLPSVLTVDVTSG